MKSFMSEKKSTSSASWRLRMAHKMLIDESDEDAGEMQPTSEFHVDSTLEVNSSDKFTPSGQNQYDYAAPEATGGCDSVAQNASLSIALPKQVDLEQGSSATETRIVAPNVSKLSPFSAVEIRLQSAKECVAVLCAVDVLKMRSAFFHDILCGQEVERSRSNDMDVGNSTASNSEPITRSDPNIMWRPPIAVPETAPYDAAAFLESLHEGRALFRGDWNFIWARLSVTWSIEDLISEYGVKIADHMNHLSDYIESNHWRTNPSRLGGMRIAVFRKGSASSPTVVTGMIVDSASSIGYSKVRVSFEKPLLQPQMNGSHGGGIAGMYAQRNNGAITPVNNPMRDSTAEAYSIYASNTSPVRIVSSGRHSHSAMTYSSPGGATHLPKHHSDTSTTVPAATAADTALGNVDPSSNIIGDVAEPFWVQNSAQIPAATWCDPDEAFLSQARRDITSTDRRIFWEMARALMEFPELSTASERSRIRTAHDLTAILKRPEYRILWQSDAPDYLPKEVAAELIRSAYVSHNE